VNPLSFVGSEDDFAIGMFAALIGATVWLFLATLYAMPVSTTHSVCGGLIGFALLTKPEAIQWNSIGMIALSWITSPLAGFVVSWFAFSIISRTTLNLPLRASRAAFKRSFPLYFGFTASVMFYFLMESIMLFTGIDLPFWGTILGAMIVFVITSFVARAWSERRMSSAGVDSKLLDGSNKDAPFWQEMNDDGALEVLSAQFFLSIPFFLYLFFFSLEKLLTDVLTRALPLMLNNAQSNAVIQIVLRLAPSRPQRKALKC
jgi:phosphate/sulfate permease